MHYFWKEKHFNTLVAIKEFKSLIGKVNFKVSKIGILTFTYGDNYGQRLQNLAVQEILKEYGFDVYTIPQYKNFRYRIRSMKKNYNGFLKGMYKFDVKRHELFEKFNRAYIKFYPYEISERNMNTFPEKDFDFFVAGSDQIWSPYSDDVNATLFLQFTIPAKRIALAPSVASDNIPQSLQKKYGEYLKGFSHLSVREEKSAFLIKSAYGLDVDVLIDPTLMFSAEFWIKYEKRPSWIMDENYILCYFLGSEYTLDNIRQYAKDNHYTILDLLSEKKYRQSGPSEFIYLIHHAKMVVTDSYHGSIFSLIFNVPLMIQNRQGDSVKMSSRFDTLYNKLNLVNNKKTGLVVANDYLKNICIEREKFRKYLNKALLGKD